MRLASRLVVAGLVALAGCATPYQSKGFTGGYTDYRAGADTIYVSYKGNGFTSEETVTRYWHMRAAEICGGNDKYEVVSRDGRATTEELAGGTTRFSGTATTYGNETTIRGKATQSEPIEVTKYGVEGYVRCVNGGSYSADRKSSITAGHRSVFTRESTPGDEAMAEARASAARGTHEPPRSPIQARTPPAAPPAAPPASVVVAGCQYDTQCKGERICQAGQCIDAPAAPSGPGATPETP